MQLLEETAELEVGDSFDRAAKLLNHDGRWKVGGAHRCLAKCCNWFEQLGTGQCWSTLLLNCGSKLCLHNRCRLLLVERAVVWPDTAARAVPCGWIEQCSLLVPQSYPMLVSKVVTLSPSFQIVCCCFNHCRSLRLML